MKGWGRVGCRVGCRVGDWLLYFVVGCFDVWRVSHVHRAVAVEERADHHDDAGCQDDKKQYAFIEGIHALPFRNFIEQQDGDQAARDVQEFGKQLFLVQDAKINEAEKQQGQNDGGAEQQDILVGQKSQVNVIAENDEEKGILVSRLSTENK